MPATLTVLERPADLGELDTLLIVGRRERLLAADVRALLPEGFSAAAWEAMVGGDARDSARTAETFTGGSPRRVAVGVLPESCSRHCPPSRALAIPGALRPASGRGTTGVVLAVDARAYAFAAVNAVASGLPAFSATSRQTETAVRIAVLAPDGPLANAAALQRSADATRLAAAWVDMPPDRLTTTHFVHIAREIARELKCGFQAIQGPTLREQGLGGLWSVGRASKDPPALVVLDHAPEGATRRVAWVGKGITYDTGGLSIKPKMGMPGMKTDMGGAAAVLAAFKAAVELGCTQRLTAVLCIAENMVGPDSMRPDDVITLLSGKTVEVNNTDAWCWPTASRGRRATASPTRSSTSPRSRARRPSPPASATPRCTATRRRSSSARWPRDSRAATHATPCPTRPSCSAPSSRRRSPT